MVILYKMYMYTICLKMQSHNVKESEKKNSGYAPLIRYTEVFWGPCTGPCTKFSANQLSIFFIILLTDMGENISPLAEVIRAAH